MFSKNNKKMIIQKEQEKINYYGIKKFNAGTASVLIAAGFAFLGGGSALASNDTVVNATSETENNDIVTANKEEVSTTTPAKANKTNLSAAIARVQEAIANAGVTEKTASVIEDSKAELITAQALEASEVATQGEVDKATVELKNKAFVLESMKKATAKEADKPTEEKVNKNQDPRNGKAIPGKGESGFRADTSSNDSATTPTTTVTNDVLTPTTPAQPTAKNIIGSTSTVSRENFTGWDTYKMPFGVQSGSGTLGVDSAEQKANAEGLQFRVFSDQRAGTREVPGPSNFTYKLQASDVKARIDYGLQLSAEEVQKIIEEAELWRGKMRYDGSRIQSLVPSTYYGGGSYEYLMSSIYKLGYEQGIDKVYIKDVSKRIEVTEEAKAAGWTVSDFTVYNFPGATYDKQTDSVQGVLTHNTPFNYQQLRTRVTFKNTITGKTLIIPLDDHRFGGVAWKDTTPPKIGINDTVTEGKVGENLVVPVEYRDAGGSHAGAPNGRNIPYNLTDENGTPLDRTITIRDTVSRAIVGVSGANITGTTGAGAGNPTELTGTDTKIPGVGFTIASNDMTDSNPNGFKGTPTEAGIYRVSIYARDYNVTNANEAYAHATFKIAPAVSVKNVHAYDKEVPITISNGASEATISLPDGTNTKIVAKNGKWVVSETTNTAVNVNDEIGTVGETFNLKVLPTATAKAATDTINVTASSENVTATFTRAEVTIKTQVGDNVTATFNKTTGRWELPSDIAEKKIVNSDGTTTWLKRDLYVDVNKNGETIFNVYEYTRTLDATGKVTAVNNPTRTLTTYNKENVANSTAELATDTNKGMVVTVKYDKGTNTWSANDNSTVTATKTGDKWTISTSSGFTGTVDAVHAESSDKASVLNDAPAVTSTSYTTVKGATVDLVKQASAAVTITDREDDATTDPTKKETTVTKVTLTSPSGKVTEYHSAAEVAAVKLTEAGNYTVKVDVKDSNGNVVTANTDTETGTDKGAETAVNSTTYTITVKDQETKKLYKVEDDTVTNDELKGKVEPTTIDGFTPTKNDFTNIPTTAGKAGQTIPTPASVTYTKGTETIPVETKVDVVVLAKVEPTGVTVLKDSTGLDEAVKAKAVEAAKAVPTDKLPDGVTVSVKEVKQGTVPATSTNGVQTPATVVVEYKDVNNNVVATKEVTVPVTVVSSTPSKIVVFEGEKPTANQAKAAVTPGTDGTKGEPTTLPETAGKAGATDVKVDVPVTYDNGKLTETVSVPVTVLPKASGEVEVPKGESVDKVKEVAKAKAAALVEAADFKGKLPTGATVTVGDITEEVLATITAEKGTNRGIVNVPATYTVDGTTYNTTVPVTINVLGSETKPVYTVEGTKPDAEKVKNAVTPGNGGTANAPTEAGLPETIGKAGATDVTATTTVTYPNGTETVTVPVTVLPKATPEKVTTLKDTTGDNLTTAVKEKAQAALGKLTLPTGVTVELVPNQTYTVPATTSNGDKDTVPVKVQYKDATGTVVAEDTINVPVTVVSSTPSKIVVFEGDEVTADQAKEAVTPGADGTKGNPVIPEDLTKTTGNKDVTVPVTYEGIKDSEQVKVPVTVLPKASGEVEVAKGSTVDKVKEVAKAKAQTLIEVADFKGKLPTGATVTVGDITEEVLATITAEKGTNKGIVNVPATYTVDGKTYNTTIPVTINVLGSERKTVYTLEGTQPEPVDVNEAITPDKGGDLTPVTEADINKDVPTDKVKVGATDLSVKATVKYPTGDETVDVPVKVLPKAAPTDVTVLKDTDENTLTDAVKAKATEAVSKLTNLPDGITASLDERETSYTLPKTDSNGDKKTVPVKVLYKDDKGNVVGEDTINVPVKVVSSTPSKIVVFEGEKPTADQAKEAVTQGADGTKGEPTTLPETAGKAGATDVKVDVPVTYDNGKLTETVSVPVTVLPKASGEVEVPKGESVDKVKEVAKAKAAALVEAADFKGKLPTGATVTVGDITEAVAETLTNEKGTNKGIVNVPATYTVDGKTYNTTVPVTINVAGSETKPVYTVEGTKPDAEKVKNAVTPGNGGTANAPTETGLPETTGKAGATDVTATTTVTYPNGTETVTVPVTVLPKATPEKVTTLKDTTGDNLTTAVKEKAQAALGKLTLPSGVTAELDPNQTYTVPATDSNGDKNNVPVKVQYKDATGTVVAEDTINVPVTVVSSTPSKIVVFEGEKPTADQAKEAVTQGADGTKGEPTTLPETAGKAGATDVKVDVPVTYDNGKLTETVSVPVTVLPKPEAEGILVAKNSDKEKAKEKVLAKAKKAIEDATFKGKLPADATVEIDNTVPVTIPELTDDTEVEVTVKYTVPGQDTPLTTKVKVPVTIVEGVPQIVPIKENNDVLPNPEKSIDKTDYPEGATFRYKTPEGQTTPIDVTTPGDKDVTVEVLDKNGNPIAEVPATVRVVESYPKYVPVDPAKKQPDPKENINPNDFPTGTTFEYKDNTPVDTTTPGEKPVTVVAKLNGQPIVEIPATIVVVEPKTQYVPVNAENDKKPKPQNSITPDDYPEGSTFEYKTPEGQTTPYDGTTPGEKDVTVVVKDSDGDTIVEVPAKIKVVQGKEQLIPVNAEDKDKPKAEDSITPSDYPEGSTFEYKVPEGQTTPYDGTTPGDKPVTVVVKDKDGKVLVEVPATIKVVESKPKPIETPVTNTPLEKDDYTKGLNIPEGATAKVGDLPDLTTPGEKTPVKVTITLPNGKSYTVDVPVNVTPVKEIETPVTNTPLTPEDYTKGIKIPEGGKVTNVENIPDLTTPGKKDPVKVTVELPNGKTITVDVPVNVTPVKEIETPVTNTPLTPEDYTKGIKIPEGGKVTNVANIPDLTTPGKKDPVKVTVELPNGKTITVDVPVNVTPVKEIETPVTNTPLTPEDYTKGIKIPEGGKVTNVENIPDLTTPGKKDPVKVTVELPNGKTITVDVPVNVTPVKEIETPVTNTPLTPEDYTKGIKIPEGGKVTNVENIPDLTTPGKKDPVKVTVELPNGKTITVDVPVKVTPVKEIETPVKEIETPVTNTPLTPEDYTKGIKIPEGGKVTNVANIPDLTTPGKKDPVKVTVELPNGKTITVDVPVKVTPVKEIETPVTNTPLTPEDYTKGIKIPEGGKVTNVANIPDLTTPGKKDPVKVTVELPNGKTITVDVPVNVTPVKEIETPVTNTPLTPEDYTKGIKIPEGGKVTNVENIPDLTTPGKKDPVKVTVELPNGKTITVDVPVKVTPVKEIETPVKEIETPVTNTPLTPEDYTKGIKIPEGGKVTNVANIPDLTTPGKKDPVKVTVELPNGKTITVDVPVKVTPVKEIETPVTNTPLTPEDYTKGIKIPEGGKVTNVENIPDLTTPGKKDPVKVTVELPNGKTITVDVPVNVTPVKEIETPVTNTPLTPEDYTKGIKIPEGGKVTNVANIPDLTTPGKKDPVKVTVELPNGKTITVDVPVNVTPVKEIETPVTNTPLTPEDYTKGIKIPEGGKVTNVENIPDLTTPGKKDPVKVTVELPNGKTITVDVPVNVTPVKEIETPVTNTPLTPEDYTKGIKIPEGGKVTNVENIPDLTTPGKKDPVKVTVELPNGKTITVDVPVKVTPVKEIETPVTNTPLTPEDYTKGIKIPEGGKVTNVENIPDLTTPGKKDPVKVTVELPNGKTITVDVPVKVTPVKEIETPVTNTPLTPEDYTKGIKIPEGGKVTNVENIPDLTTPGKKDPVKVTVELPNGKTITVDVPVNVTPVKEIETPVTNTPLTPEDYTKGIKIPEGGKVTNVANIPDLTTPGKKDPVKVTIELPNGKTITVDVPVNVTPVKEIETPVTNTPLTPEDYTKGIKIPEGGKVTNVANIPDLTTPGKKDPVKVTVELPNGKTITVDVPVNVTPVKEIETPVTNTPLTPEDYTKGIKIPEGGKVTNVENIPDLTTPGKKDPVKVTVELPNGKTITVDVPVKVTPVKEIETPVKEIETPVTNTPLTPEDYTKGIKIPEGGKVTNVANIPDLTTPGKKDPVKVTVELPNGKTITVDVPVKVTPVKEIETPVTNTPLTPEDYTKGIKIPEGGKVTNVANIPDLTTPGKKDPVKVTVELPNGKTITVDVPVNVTPVKEIETPVTNTPLTPEDYTKGIKIPEGGKVTNVENIPDLTTPGKKDPVKVTVELPNGKTITVDVPVKVTPVKEIETPVKEIETPVTNTPLTPEDYTKGIKIPEGGKVTNVANIPDLTTPGKKDPVKVTVELPNGKTITVDVPVKVTPVKEIETPVTNTPLTPEDYTKGIKIPEGGKVTNVANIPDLTTPGKKDPVKVTVELPNGKTITVDVPVNVTPVKEIETPVTNTPLTPEDYTKGIKIPEGGKVTNVENIPDLTTPGKKDPVKVTVELPNGKTITVDVPVNVTPVKEIETPVTNTPLTPEDYTKGIKIPEGGKVTNVANIPDLTTPGKKDPVKVTVELPNGKTITVDVPVNVTPVKEIETPVTNTPLTPEDYTKGIKIPEGGKVTNVENIPDLTTPGKKDPVKVTIELPNGKVVTVDVPVNVTPVKEIETPVTTTPLTPEDYTKGIKIPEGGKVTNVANIPDLTTPGKKDPVKVTIELPNGKVITVEVPVIVTPKSTPTPRPEKPSTTEVTVNPEKSKATVVKEGEKVLPNTGIADDNSTLAGLGLAILGLVGLVRRRKQK